MKLSHRYLLFNTVKTLTILSQLAITAFFLLWCHEYVTDNWSTMSNEISKLFRGNDDYLNLYKLFLPILYQFIIFIAVLVLLGFARSFAKSMSISHKHIIFWINNKEIHPLFAYRLSQHFMWSRNIGHQDFFIFWKEFKSQNKILELHQKEKDFYDFLTTFNTEIRDYKPYPTPSKSIIRREDVLTKIEPDVGLDESDKDKDMI